jgi:hypothetical protein
MDWMALQPLNAGTWVVQCLAHHLWQPISLAPDPTRRSCVMNKAIRARSTPQQQQFLKGEKAHNEPVRAAIWYAPGALLPSSH